MNFTDGTLFKSVSLHISLCQIVCLYNVHAGVVCLSAEYCLSISMMECMQTSPVCFWKLSPACNCWKFPCFVYTSKLRIGPIESLYILDGNVYHFLPYSSLLLLDMASQYLRLRQPSSARSSKILNLFCGSFNLGNTEEKISFYLLRQELIMQSVLLA